MDLAKPLHLSLLGPHPAQRRRFAHHAGISARLTRAPRSPGPPHVYTSAFDRKPLRPADLQSIGTLASQGTPDIDTRFTRHLSPARRYSNELDVPVNLRKMTLGLSPQ